jgi:hypothetical protein
MLWSLSLSSPAPHETLYLSLFIPDAPHFPTQLSLLPLSCDDLSVTSYPLPPNPSTDPLFLAIFYESPLWLSHLTPPESLTCCHLTPWLRACSQTGLCPTTLLAPYCLIYWSYLAWAYVVPRESLALPL